MFVVVGVSFTSTMMQYRYKAKQKYKLGYLLHHLQDEDQLQGAFKGCSSAGTRTFRWQGRICEGFIVVAEWDQCGG